MRDSNAAATLAAAPLDPATLAASPLDTSTLSAARTGGVFFVLALEPGMPVQHRRRLAELGVRPGATFRVAQRTAGGGLVISNGSTRYAMDKRTASSITVREAALDAAGVDSREASA